MSKLSSIQYAEKAISGKGVFSKQIIKAAKRFLADLKRDDLIFDYEAVERIEAFWSKVIYVPELKKPVKLQPPHAFWIHQLYGFKYKETGLRRFKTVYVQIARKNLKTFEAAGITLTEILLGNDNFAEVMHGANSRDQALICTSKTGHIIKSSPELRALVDDGRVSLHTYKKQVNTITYETDGRFCRVEAMPKNPGDGGNPSVGIVDEFHEAKDIDLLETIQSGQGQRREPLTIVITSPGDNKNGPCYSILRRKSIDVLDGKSTDDRHLSVLFELDDPKEWDNIKMLEKSNPMIPYISTIKPYLVDRIKDAKEMGGATRAKVQIRNCGIWIDAPKIWIPSETVKANSFKLNEDDLLGRECYAGWDMARGTDLNAFGLLFPDVDGKMVWKCWFWIIEARVVQMKTDTVDYRKFVDEGHLIMQQEDMINYQEVAEVINKAHQDYDVISDGADPYNLRIGPAPFVHDSVEVTPIGQTFSNLTAPTEQVEQWLVKKEMNLLFNPVMEMCFSNVTLHMKDAGEQEGGHSGHRMPSKSKSNGRIDGVAALNNAVFEYLRLKAEPARNVGVATFNTDGWF